MVDMGKKDQRKRVDVTLVIHTHMDVPADWDDEMIRFRVEELRCRGDYLREIIREEDRNGGCDVCTFSKACVGHLDVVGLGEKKGNG